MPNQIIRVGSRESVLAVAQTELVMETIRKNHPEVELELVTMKTTGDKILDKSLDKIGGKGLFVKELDKALMEGRIDISVHSLKDMPMETPDELPILAYSKRGNPFDCLVLPEGVDSWDHTTPAGCSGHRRRVQLQKLFGDVPIKGIRGNIHTRLNKLDSGEYGALVLACSGLARVGLSSRIHHVFTLEEMIPSAGQGILAVQGRKGEDYSWLMETDDPISRIQATAERAFVRTLDGGCSSPIAAYAQVSGQEVLLTAACIGEKTAQAAKEYNQDRPDRKCPEAGRNPRRRTEKPFSVRMRRGEWRAVRWKRKEKSGWSEQDRPTWGC